MQNNKYSSVIIFIMIVFCRIVCAEKYVDLDHYKDYVYGEQPKGFVDEIIENSFSDTWNSFKSSMNEIVVSDDNIITEHFWNTLRNSLKDGTFYNRFANAQIKSDETGTDVFMKSVYRSIDQVAVKYKSVSPQGDTIVLSGKLFLPKNKKAKHIIIANHYTICANSEAPSCANSIEGLFATKDYIVIMPDYIGYGISDSLTHPYLHLKSSVTSAIDLLEATIPYLKANSYTFNKSLILVGYSQGAAVTLALQKELEEFYSYEFPIHKVYAGAGPYDLAGTFDYYINNPQTNIPCSLPMLILGLNYGENLGINRNDFFQPFLLQKCPLLIESKCKTMNQVNKELGSDIMLLLKPIIFEKDSFPTSVLYDAVKRNSIVRWTPKTKLYLFHSIQDDMVPFFNSSNLKIEFESQHLKNIQYDFDFYGGHMIAAVYFFEKVYKML